MASTETRPSRNQTDAEILAALDLHTGHDTLSLDRSDPYRFLILGTYPGQDGDMYVGRAVLAAIPGAPTGRRWYLGCVGCDLAIEAADAGYCPTCRELMAADEAAFNEDIFDA